MVLNLCIMFVAQDDSEQHTKVDDKRDALKVEHDKLEDVEIRTDRTVEAYKEHLDTLQQYHNER